MVTESEYTGNDKYMGAVTLYGLSTDTKPISVGNGSCFVEMDTGTISFFDAESSDWIEFDSTGVALPSVSSSDNGDVLTVVNGAWDKAAPSGVLVVHEIYDEQTEKTTLDKTWQEIYDADFAVIRVVIREENDLLYVCPMVHAIVQNGAYYVYFCMTQPSQTIEPYQEMNAYSTDTANGYPTYID